MKTTKSQKLIERGFEAITGDVHLKDVKRVISNFSNEFTEFETVATKNYCVRIYARKN